MPRSHILILALLTASSAHAGFEAGRDPLRTVTQILPGSKPGEYAITLRWTPTSCAQGYAVRVARTEDMQGARETPVSGRPELSFRTTYTGDFFWQVGCRGEKSAAEAGVITHAVPFQPGTQPAAVPAELTRKVSIPENTFTPIRLQGAEGVRYRFELYSRRLEKLRTFEGVAGDLRWPRLTAGDYVFRIQTLSADGKGSLFSPLAHLQVGGGASAAASASTGVALSLGLGLSGTGGTQASARSGGVNGDLNSGMTGVGRIGLHWAFNERWAFDFRLLAGSSNYNDPSGVYQSAKFMSADYRAVVQHYIPSGNKFWILGAGASSRNHPFIAYNGLLNLAVAGARTNELAIRAGVEFRPNRWQHTIRADLLAPVAMQLEGGLEAKQTFAPNIEVEATSLYSLSGGLSVGAFLGLQLTNVKFTYTAQTVEETVTLKNTRFAGGVLGQYKF